MTGMLFVVWPVTFDTVGLSVMVTSSVFCDRIGVISSPMVASICCRVV